jgi:hypothetical protein
VLTTELAAMTYEQHSIYERSLLYYLDMKNVVKTAVDVKVLEIAENLILKGLDNQFIVDITGLTLAQLQELRKSMK